MTPDSVSRTSIAILAFVATAAAAYLADVVFAPLTLAVFIIALVWPMQRWLQSRTPAFLALAVTMTVTVLTMLVFASLVAWGFGRVGRSLIADSGRYQAIFNAAVAWLDGHGISAAGLWAEHFNVGWMLRGAQQITGPGQHHPQLLDHHARLRDPRADGGRGRGAEAQGVPRPETARALAGASADTARKFRKYMEVRTLMSLATGALVWGFAAVTGLQFAVEWGVIAFALNYIPFIGPFIATLFPTLLAMAQFATWQAALGVFVCLNVIQFVIGSYVEPRMSGKRAVDLAVGRPVRRVLLDVSVGPLRRVHRRADRHRRPHVLRAFAFDPMDRGFAARWPKR